jgi:nitroreductase
MLSRRGLLLAGGAACAGAVGARAWQTGLVGAGDGARELWRDWRGLPGTMPVVAAGVLAASAHNTQPWRFLPRGDVIDLEADARQDLGAVDPFARQKWLGVGCAVENMVAAAAGLGRQMEVALAEDGPAVARLSLGATAAARPELLDRISRRHTNRAPYQDRPIDRPIVDELRALSRDSAARLDLLDHRHKRGAAFATATIDATRTLIADADFMRASDAWFRATPREEKQHRDGPSLRCSGLPGWKRVASGLAPRLSDSATHQAWLQLTAERHVGTAAAFGVISLTEPASRRALVEAGRLWQRLQLAATGHGLGFQPLDQLLEVADRDRQLSRPAAAQAQLAALAEPGWHPVLTFRLGWPTVEAPASARRPLATFLPGSTSS